MDLGKFESKEQRSQRGGKAQMGCVARVSRSTYILTHRQSVAKLKLEGLKGRQHKRSMTNSQFITTPSIDDRRLSMIVLSFLSWN